MYSCTLKDPASHNGTEHPRNYGNHSLPAPSNQERKIPLVPSLLLGPWIQEHWRKKSEAQPWFAGFIPYHCGASVASYK